MNQDIPILTVGFLPDLCFHDLDAFMKLCETCHRARELRADILRICIYEKNREAELLEWDLDCNGACCDSPWRICDCPCHETDHTREKYNKRIVDQMISISRMKFLYVMVMDITNREALENILGVDDMWDNRDYWREDVYDRLADWVMVSGKIPLIQYVIVERMGRVGPMPTEIWCRYLSGTEKYDLISGNGSPDVVRFLIEDELRHDLNHDMLMSILVEVIRYNRTDLMEIVGRALIKKNVPVISDVVLCSNLNRVRASAKTFPGVGPEMKEYIEKLIPECHNPDMYKRLRLFWMMKSREELKNMENKKNGKNKKNGEKKDPKKRNR